MVSNRSMTFVTDKSNQDLDAKVLDALASLNQIGLSINRLGSVENVSLTDILRLIVDSATKVVPGAAAILYAYDESGRSFDPTSRVSAGSSSARRC